MKTLGMKGLMLGALLVIGSAACADLDVVNPNDPSAERALRTAGDVESLIAGAYNTWFHGSYSYYGPGLFLSNASFQHAAPWANAGMVQYSAIPRTPIVNDAADQFFVNISRPWYFSYRALAAVSDGLRAMQSESLSSELGAERVDRVRAYAKFVQGMAHATIAVLYDRGFVIDETVNLSDTQTLQSYEEVMAAALGYFDQAITMSQGKSFTIPETWFADEVTAAELVRIARSMKARYRVALARTSTERQAVNWDAVIADVDGGVTEDWIQNQDPDNGWYNEVADLGTYPGWAQTPYWVLGMADQSGNYQAWLARPLEDKRPTLPSGDAVVIVTPDTRLPRGATVAAQSAASGSLYEIPAWGIANMWQRPDRQTWRWSYYWGWEHELYGYFVDFHFPEIRVAEMRLLKAEALFRKSLLAEAAALVNVSRTQHGLNATNAAGSNTSCVPKLPNGNCGNLFEMLKWEKRQENRFIGLFGAPWFFDSRGWGDLFQGTYLHFPIPCRELNVLNMLPCYTFGGSEGGAAARSTYAWPGEG
jgi:hypothetical protein